MTFEEPIGIICVCKQEEELQLGLKKKQDVVGVPALAFRHVRPGHNCTVIYTKTGTFHFETCRLHSIYSSRHKRQSWHDTTVVSINVTS